MKRPNVPLPSVMGRMAAELTVIVAGVLIALGAQSWWEQRGVETDRRNAIEAISDDLVAASASLAGSTARIDTVAGDIRWLLDRGADPSTDSTFNQRVQNALWEIVSARLQLPAYEDIKGAGRLTLLPREVRAAMLELENRILLLDRSSEDNFQYQIRNLDPWLLDNAPLRTILRYDESLGRDPGPGRPQISAEVLTSRRVENMMLAKLELLTNLRENAERAERSIAAVLATTGNPESD